jgi:urease accessory protein
MPEHGGVIVRSEPIGNVESYALGARRLERVSIRSDDLAKRILRLTTSAGEIGLRFAGAERLRDGDVIFADENVVVAVCVDADDVLIFRPATIAAAIGIAHALGNRHLPIQSDGDAIVVRFDPLLEALGAEHGVPVTREQRVFAQPFRHAHAPHAHE